jgi:hypothetical protein
MFEWHLSDIVGVVEKQHRTLTCTWPPVTACLCPLCVLSLALYRTDPQWSTQQASYGPDDFLEVQNVQPHHTLCCEVRHTLLPC